VRCPVKARPLRPGRHLCQQSNPYARHGIRANAARYRRLPRADRGYERMSALMRRALGLGGDDEATHIVPNRGTPLHREDHCCAAHRNRAESTSSHEGRMGQGTLRARESANGTGRDRRTAHPDRAARPRTRQQRRDRLRPLGSRRAHCSTAGSSRPRRDRGDALLRTHPSRAAETT
jgi:hypothetical protein